jgi:hypothetical protein
MNAINNEQNCTDDALIQLLQFMEELSGQPGMPWELCTPDQKGSPIYTTRLANTTNLSSEIA